MSERESIEDAWTRLSTHLDWADRFWVAFLFVDDPRVIEALKARAQAQLEAAGRGLMALGPSPSGGVDELLEQVLEGDEAGGAGVAWVDLVRHDDRSGRSDAPDWGAAWERLMLRLNERRELLRRRWARGGVVFATTLDRLDGTAALAPDLWTIRAMLLRLASLPAEQQVPVVSSGYLEELARGAQVATVRDPKLARLAVERMRSRGDALGLLEALVVLAEAETGEAALATARRARAKVAALLEGADDEGRSQIAARLRQLGDVFTREDARAEAEPCWRESIELEQEVHGTRLRPEVADGLEGLAEAISRVEAHAPVAELARVDEALQLAREGVEIRRALMKEQPDAQRSGLAWALVFLGLRLVSLGRREEAAPAEQEAVEHFRKLAETRPEAHLPGLGMALNRLGANLLLLGREEEALAATQGSVEYFRKLVAAWPEKYRLDLGRALGLLGFVHETMGQHMNARDSYDEGLRTIRPFARLPSAYDRVTSALVHGLRRVSEALGVDIPEDLEDLAALGVREMDRDESGA